jgi:hypothetical protein
MAKFYDSYKAVFDAIKVALVYVAAVPEVPAVPAIPAHDDVPEVPEVPAVPGVAAHGVSELKTVLVGEQFSLDSLPKAIINPVPGPISPATNDGLLNVLVRGVITVAIQEYKPKDWFVDVILPMGAVVDVILADRKLGGACKDCVTTEFAPGEIKFKDAAGKDRLLYGGDIFFEAKLWFKP